MHMPVHAHVCVSRMKTVLTIMGILNLNEANAAIKRCCHGNDKGSERVKEAGASENRMTVRRLNVVWEQKEC